MDDRWNRAPDLIEPLVGYRTWCFTMSEGKAHLLSPFAPMQEMTAKNDWEGAWRGWVTASCFRRFSEPWHVAPDESCRCGFYAMRTQEQVETGVVPALVIPGAMSGTVMGRVELAGKVIEHASGYRAERARITELIAAPGTERSVMLLAARLDLPIAYPMDEISHREEMFPQYRSSLGPTALAEPDPIAASRLRLRLGDWVRMRILRRGMRVVHGEGQDPSPVSTGVPMPAWPSGGGSPASA